MAIDRNPHQTATMAIANTTRAVTQRRTDPYGNARGAAAAWPGDRGFLNKVQDTSGLTQVGARYYDAKIGRFVSVDPVFATSSPQQWGAYSYADNNPVSYWDPSGELSIGKWWKSAKSKAGSALRSAGRFIKKHQAEIVGGIIGGVVTGVCLAGTWGVGSVGCAALGGAAAGAATNLYRTAMGRQRFSVGSLIGDTVFGGVVGAATAGLGSVAAPLLRRGAAALASSARGAGAAIQAGARRAAAAASGAVRRTADSVASAVRSAARTVKAPPPVDDIPTVAFSRSRAPGLARNFDAAVADGAPTTLNRVSRADARANRRDALRGHPAAPNGFSLDEYPFASSAQGGAGSRIEAVKVGEQNCQGGVLSSFFQNHGVRVGDAFHVTFGP